MTLLFFLRAVVRHLKDAAAGNARLEQDQSAMRVDRQCIGVLAKIFALRIVAGNLYADLHQDALAAAAHADMGCVLQWLGHGGLSRTFNSL